MDNWNQVKNKDEAKLVYMWSVNWLFFLIVKKIFCMKNWLDRKNRGGHFELHINITQIVYPPFSPRNIEIVSFMISEMAYAAILFALVSVLYFLGHCFLYCLDYFL